MIPPNGLFVIIRRNFENVKLELAAVKQGAYMLVEVFLMQGVLIPIVLGNQPA